MKKRNVLIVALLSVMVLTFAGCGTEEIVPEEHMDTVSEYAAIKLLKYDANSRSRLVDQETIDEAERRQEAWDKAGAEKPSSTPVPEGMDPVDDVPVIDKGAEKESAYNSLEAYYGTAEGIRIQYVDYEICDSYSQNKDDAIVLEASQGNRLVVMKFKISNQSSKEIPVDLFGKKARYRVTINDEYICSAMRTLLMNDMTTYVSSLSADSSEEIVLVAEVSDELSERISGIEVYMKNESKIYTIQIL